jgi:hypothetical protein
VLIGLKCHPYRADHVCRGRFDAVMRGAFGWDEDLKGFVCNDLLVRTRSEAKDNDSRWRRIFYEVEDHTGEPWTLERCPYCGFPLPEHPLQQTDPYNGRDIELELGLAPPPKMLGEGLNPFRFQSDGEE